MAVLAHFAGIRLDDPDERLAWRTAPQVEIEKLLEGTSPRTAYAPGARAS